MKTVNKIPITAKHLLAIREKHDCKGMTDKQVIAAMLSYEEKYGSGVTDLLTYLCFPTFQSILYYEKSKDT